MVVLIHTISVVHLYILYLELIKFDFDRLKKKETFKSKSSSDEGVGLGDSVQRCV